MLNEQNAKDGNDKSSNLTLSFFACPNSECADFNKFDAGNLSVAERMGKDKAIRRLYCKTCGTRFSERRGSLMQYTKLSQEDVVRVVKCLGHGCSVEATADICEVDARTVQSLLEKAGKRAADFHRLQLEKIDQPIEVVQMDELHGKTVKDKCNANLLSCGCSGISSIAAAKTAEADSNIPASNGSGPGRESMDCFEVSLVSGSCQRLTIYRLGRAA